MTYGIRSYSLSEKKSTNKLQTNIAYLLTILTALNQNILWTLYKFSFCRENNFLSIDWCRKYLFLEWQCYRFIDCLLCTVLNRIIKYACFTTCTLCSCRRVVNVAHTWIQYYKKKVTRNYPKNEKNALAKHKIILTRMWTCVIVYRTWHN